MALQATQVDWPRAHAAGKPSSGYEVCTIGVSCRVGKESFGRCSNAVSACGWIPLPFLSLQSPRFYRAGAPTKSIETWQLIAWLSGRGGKSSMDFLCFLAQWQMSFFNGFLAC